MNALVPMQAAELASYLRDAVPAYAREKVRSGQWSEAEAPRLAHETFAKLLPNGLATPDQHLFTIEHDGDAVGMVWIAARARGDERIAYVNDVVVFEGHRRRGYATWAFEALEREVRSLGLAGIALHVFGHNTAAIALYEKLGYAPTNINRYKRLPDG